MDDAALTDALAQLGLHRDRWRAVALLPLVEVAWADGRIQAAELRILHEVAARHGIPPGDPFLERWLARRPPRTAFLQARAVLVQVWQAEDGDGVEALLADCLRVAKAAGGLFGVFFTVEASERAVLAEIAQSLQTGPALPAAPRATPAPAARRLEARRPTSDADAPTAPDTPAQADPGGRALLEDPTVSRGPPTPAGPTRSAGEALLDEPTLRRGPGQAPLPLSPSAVPTAALERPRRTPAPAPPRPFDPNETLLRETPVLLDRDRARPRGGPPPEVDTERMVRPAALDSPTLVPHGGRDEYLTELEGDLDRALGQEELTSPYVDVTPEALAAAGHLEDDDR